MPKDETFDSIERSLRKLHRELIEEPARFPKTKAAGEYAQMMHRAGLD